MPHTHRPLALALLGLSLALALPPDSQAGPQQDRMRACNKEAKAKTFTGNDRREFMSTCLSSGKKDAAKSASADDGEGLRKKQCTTDAKEKSLKGDERKTFIAECLKT